MSLGPNARLVIARPFNHTGPGQDQRFVLPYLAAQIAEIEAGLKPPQVKVGNLSAQRDFLDVRDVCIAYLGMLATESVLSHVTVFNVASGRSYRISNLVEAFRAHAKLPFEVVVDPARLRPSDIPLSMGVSEKLTATTGWRPMVTIDDIIESLLDHWRNVVSPIT